LLGITKLTGSQEAQAQNLPPWYPPSPCYPFREVPGLVYQKPDGSYSTICNVWVATGKCCI
jgi:hypothetical protein